MEFAFSSFDEDTHMHALLIGSSYNPDEVEIWQDMNIWSLGKNGQTMVD